MGLHETITFVWIWRCNKGWNRLSPLELGLVYSCWLPLIYLYPHYCSYSIPPIVSYPIRKYDIESDFQTPFRTSLYLHRTVLLDHYQSLSRQNSRPRSLEQNPSKSLSKDLQHCTTVEASLQARVIDKYRTLLNLEFSTSITFHDLTLHNTNFETSNQLFDILNID